MGVAVAGENGSQSVRRKPQRMTRATLTNLVKRIVILMLNLAAEARKGKLQKAGANRQMVKMVKVSLLAKRRQTAKAKLAEKTALRMAKEKQAEKPMTQVGK